ncbi:MAG: PHP domain-containing protein, partial [Pseudomonadales bacterium]
MRQTFVHLRLHTEYSISDGMVRVKPLLDAVVAGQMPAVAVTDNSNLFAQVKFQNAAAAAGVKPIVASDIQVITEEDDEPTPLVLIARTNEGYRNLCELLSRAYVEGTGSLRGKVRRKWLSGQSGGLIALSGGRQGDIGKAILAGNAGLAEDRLRGWMQVFPDGFYIELQRTGLQGEEDYIHGVIPLAAQLKCPVVATNAVCFLIPDEYEAHEVRVCIHDSRTLDDPRREQRHS